MRLINRPAGQLHGNVQSRCEPAGLVLVLDVPVDALREGAAP